MRAHEYGTAQELLRQSRGPIAGFVGSGGTFTGVARALKAARPSTVCMAIEPATAPYLAGAKVTDARHRIQGGGYSRDLPLFDMSYCDGFLTVTVTVTDADAIARARSLARVEGIFAGFSTGANLVGAQQLIERLGPGAVVACLACDSGLKYLSTDLYGAPT